MTNRYHRIQTGLFLLLFLCLGISTYAQTEEELRMINECRDEEHKIIREYNRQVKRGGPADEAERERIINQLYAEGKLYKSQRLAINGSGARVAAVIPAPVPLGTIHTFGNGALKGSWVINKITNDKDGVRLDRTVYDPSANHLYAINTIGQLVDGAMVDNGALLRKNHQVIIQERGFTGLKLANGTFRLIGGLNPVDWTSGALYYSDDEGKTWTESSGGEFSTSRIIWTDVMADNSILSIVGRIINDVSSLALIRSTNNGATYSVVKSWPDSETTRIIATKIYNTDDGCVILRKLRTAGTTEVYHYKDEALSLKSTISSSEIPFSITGTNLSGWKVYVGTDSDNGFYSADGITYGSRATLKKSLETVVPYNASMLFSRDPQQDYSTDGGLTWKKYPDNNVTIGWDPKHVTFYKKTDGKWYMVIANDMGLSFSTDAANPLNTNAWKHVNNKHSYAILHGGVSDDQTGLLVTNHQDPGTFELTSTGAGTFDAVKRQGADGLRSAISNGGNSYWFRHYWDQFFHQDVKSTQNNVAIEVVGPSNWYTPPFKGSTKANEDAIYVSGYSKLIKLTYNSTTRTITRTNLPYDFLAEAGDVTLGVGVAKSDWKRIYVATKNGRFFTSKDAGQTWTETTYSGTKPTYNTPLYNQSAGYFIEVADKNANIVLWGGGANSAACLISKDGGVTFTPMLSGMPANSTIRGVSVSPTGDIVFSSNLYFYLASDNKWYPMKGESFPGGLDLNSNIKSVVYLPTQKKVQYFTWGVGVLDFKISSLSTRLGVFASEDITLSNGGQVSFAPNPVSDRLQVKLENLNTTATISVWTMAGRKYTSTHVHATGTKTIDIQTSDLPSGMYILQIQTDKESVQKKFIKE